MRTDWLLGKLQPLIPKQVSQWRRALEFADHRVRDLLEKQVALYARRHLGDYHGKLLLSLPPRQKAKGEIGLGTVLYEKDRWPAGVTGSELLQNLAIFGRSGAGKTNLAFHVLQQLITRGTPFVFLDFKRTARHLLPSSRFKVYTAGRKVSPLPFNPLVPPPGLEARVYAGHVVDVIGDAFTLGDAARSVLLKALLRCYDDTESPTIAMLAEKVKSVPDSERVRGWKASALRALETLSLLNLASQGQTQLSVVQELLRSSTVIEVDGLPPSGKKFLVPLLVLWLYYAKLPDASREKLDLVVIVEEAHNVLYRRTGNESLMEMVLRQCREIGIGMILVDQHPSLISQAALGNAYTTICLNLKDPTDVKKAADLCNLDETERRHFTRLPVGHAIIKLQDRWQHPFLVRIPRISVNKGAITDELLREDQNGGVSAGSDSRIDPPAERALDDGSRPADTMTPDAQALLNDILSHPESGVDARYNRLGLSADRGNKTKKSLVEAGWIVSELVRTGNTRRLVLRLTPEAGAAANQRGQVSRESLLHHYWKSWYAQALEQRGYDVTKEAGRLRGRVDVLAVRESHSLAVEIETGKSDVVNNVIENLRAGFDEILVVATSESVLHKIEGALGKAGLLLPRIRLAVGSRLLSTPR